jgi:hypothetical protein
MKIPVPVITAERIYLFGNGACVSAKRDFLSVNLKNSQNWRIESFFSEGMQLYDSHLFRQQNYLLSNAGLAVLSSDDSYEFFANQPPVLGPATRIVVDSFTDVDPLYIINEKTLYRFTGASWQVHKEFAQLYRDAALLAARVFVLAGDFADLHVWEEETDALTAHSLNRPLGTVFRRFAVDGAGNFFAATSGMYGTSSDRAAYRIDGEWYDLRLADNHFSTFGNNIISVALTAGEEAVWATYGRGLYVQRGPLDFSMINRSGLRSATFRINNADITVPNDPAYNDYLGYVSVESDTSYVIMNDMVLDGENTLWLTNHLSHTLNGLIAVLPNADGSISLAAEDWLYWDMRIPYSGSLQATYVGVICTDPFSQVWVGTRFEGVARLYTNYTTRNQNDDSWRVFRAADGLKSESILSLAADESGTIFVGTSNGLNMISGSTVFDLRGDYAPLGLNIAGIERDGRGNLWFATDIGVSMLEADKNAFAPENWHHFTVDNSGLLDNFCYGLYIDNKTSRIYIGTDKGISVFNSNYLANNANPGGDLIVGPNPLRLPGQQLTIAGINKAAEVKILTASGSLVRKFTSAEIVSGLVAWDGRNLFAEAVASGVYVIIAATEEGETQTAKLVVLR